MTQCCKRKTSAISGTRAGFTLVELLVVIAILAVLLAILMPTLKRAKGLAARAKDVSGTYGVLRAVHLYAAASRSWFPNACRETPAGADVGYGHDDMVAFRYSSWVVLRDSYGLTTENSCCTCFEWQAKDYGKPDFTTYGGTVIGRIIWGNRRNTFPNLGDTQVYKTPKGPDDVGTSNTYMTCRAFVRYPTWANGVVPHTDGGSAWDYTDCGIMDPYNFAPMPDGMVIGYTDGGAAYRPWTALKAVHNHNWLYYDPVR